MALRVDPNQGTLLDKAVMALLSGAVLPYAKWEELKGKREARHHNYADDGERKQGVKNSDILEIPPDMLFPDDRKPERILYIDTRAPQISANNAYRPFLDKPPALNALGQSSEILSDGLRNQYGLPHEDYTVLYLMADNKGFKGYNPVTQEGQQREDREASYLTVVLTAEGHKKLAAALLKRMADPATGAAMLDVDADRYASDFADDAKASGRKAIVDRIISLAGFTKADTPLLSEVVEIAKAHGSNDYGMYLTLKSRALPPEGAGYIDAVSGRPDTRRGI